MSKSGVNQRTRSISSAQLDRPTILPDLSNLFAYQHEMDQNSNAPQRPNPPRLTNEPPPLSNDPQASTNEATHPTNRIHDIKLGRGAIHFNVTNQNGHVWDLQRQNIKDGSVTCNGNMNDESIQALAAAIGHRQEENPLQSESDTTTSSFSGTGRTIADRAS